MENTDAFVFPMMLKKTHGFDHFLQEKALFIVLQYPSSRFFKPSQSSLYSTKQIHLYLHRTVHSVSVFTKYVQFKNRTHKRLYVIY